MTCPFPDTATNVWDIGTDISHREELDDEAGKISDESFWSEHICVEDKSTHRLLAMKVNGVKVHIIFVWKENDFRVHSLCV